MKDAGEIASMLNNDIILKNDLGMQDSIKTSSDQVQEKLRKWCQLKSAVTYAILLNSTTVVGTISLSNIDAEAKTAGIGYWVGSHYRGNGYCSRAFKLVVDEASRRGIRRLKSSIAQGNTHSERIWERLGAQRASVENGKAVYELRLKQK